MTTNRRALTYLAIVFAFSWSVVSIAWLNGARTLGEAPLANQLFSFGPPIAALICAMLFHRGMRIAVLGLRFRPNRWWLIAPLIAHAMNGYSLGMGELFPSLVTAHIGDIQDNAALLTQRQVADLPTGLAGAAVIFMIAAAGFSLVQGLIWGVWHWPMVICFGMVFADDRLLGLAFYPLMTMIISPVATLLRDRGGSIWAPGIWHGTNNAIGIVVLGQLFVKTEPNFLALLANAPLLLLVEWFRRTWPDETAM